jgi:hypothetical protein
MAQLLAQKIGVEAALIQWVERKEICATKYAQLCKAWAIPFHRACMIGRCHFHDGVAQFTRMVQGQFMIRLSQIGHVAPEEPT